MREENREQERRKEWEQAFGLLLVMVGETESGRGSKLVLAVCCRWGDETERERE